MQSKTLLNYQSKYKALKHELQKMQLKYETEVNQLVEQMEKLRILVTDVVSQQSESKAPPVQVRSIS